VAVKCPKCQFENPEDTFYCGKCATPLPSAQDIDISRTQTLETPREELSTGSTFAGRYQIIEELGHGGMGRIYRAVDNKLNEEVALKLIRPEIAADKRTLERFHNELKLARKISHPNVGRMYELLEENGVHFITMEYVPGEDLKSSIRRFGQLPIGKSISITKQICEGLAEAHKIGVIHRDLKPSNIMVDKEGNAKVMDFGIARSLKTKGITGEGVSVGTPEYMSPEQVEGKEAEQRSDIYSLGIILYEMLTGRVPFEGDTPFTIGVKHKSEIPRNPKELNAQIPEDLSRLILRCLEKDEEKRYQSAGEVRSGLERIERGIPTIERVVPTKKPLTSKEMTVTFGLKKLLIPALAVFILIIAAVIIWQLLPKKQAVPIPSGQLSLAVMYFKNNTGDESFDIWKSAISDSIITDLLQSKLIRVLSGDRLYSILRKLNLLEAKSYASEDLKEVAIEGGVNHILQGSLSKAGDTFRIDYTLQKISTGITSGSGRVEGRGLESVFSMVDELTGKIKANFKLSEEEISGDINSEKEDFVKGALIISNMEAPRLIKRIDPIYPEIARQARVEGMVLLNTRVDKQGNVEAVRVLRAIPLLDQAAIDAVKEWKYEPMIVDGKAIPVIFTVWTRFNLRGCSKVT
jgi:serine/threonine-protein kinase